MNGPDGLEERTAFNDELHERACDECDLAEQLVDESRDDLLDIAEAKMLSWALDRVIE